jgi:hypothetical protein
MVFIEPGEGCAFIYKYISSGKKLEDLAKNVFFQPNCQHKILHLPKTIQ